MKKALRENWRRIFSLEFALSGWQLTMAGDFEIAQRYSLEAICKVEARGLSEVFARSGVNKSVTTCSNGSLRILSRCQLETEDGVII